MNLDEQLFLLGNSHHTPLMDIVMSAYTSPWMWVPFYVACFAALLYKYGWVKALMMVAVIGLAIGASDFICASIIRPAFHRLRPCNLDNPFSEFVTVVNNSRGGRYGFPSCHAANSFALAGALATFMRSRKLTVILTIWALFICFTRIYLGKHYPTDLLVGAIIGLTLGISMAVLTIRYANRMKRYKEGKGFDTITYSFTLVNNTHTLSLTPIALPVSVLLVTLLAGPLIFM